MRKANIVLQLHLIADFNLLGSGCWPGTKEFCIVFAKTLDDLGLTIAVPGCQGTTRDTALGRELKVDLMIVFAGAYAVLDIPFILEKNGYLDAAELDEIWNCRSEAEAERLVHQHVLRAYYRFCNLTGCYN